MLAPPDRLDIAELTTALASGWHILDPAIDYLAVGFGSHHWRATGRDGQRWFVTVDEHRKAGTLADLRRAFTTASALHRDAALRFVAAPIPDVTGAIIRVLGGCTFSVAVTTWLDGTPLSGYGPVPAVDRPEVLRMLGVLHAATSDVDPTIPLPLDLALPGLDALSAALDAIDEPWDSGPFGEPARALLRSDRSRLDEALVRYNALVARVRVESSPWVITHGEPHAANILRGPDGALHLIDWDTVRLAPRERDLWDMRDDDTDMSPYRTEAGNIPVSTAALRLFRMRWDLGEVAIYVAQFHAPHEDDPNTREAWENLGDYLPVHADHLAAVAR